MHPFVSIKLATVHLTKHDLSTYLMNRDEISIKFFISTAYFSSRDVVHAIYLAFILSETSYKVTSCFQHFLAARERYLFRIFEESDVAACRDGVFIETEFFES